MLLATELAAQPLAAPSSPGLLTLESKLGAGASAEVWRARTASGQPVHLKLGRDASAVPSFVAEVKGRILGASPMLQRPLTLGWFSMENSSAAPSSASAGRPGLVLEAREGAALREAVTESLERAAVLCTQIGCALAALHDGGVAHGDVKLENIVADAACAFLIDLGLSTSTRSRQVEGATPRYLALGDMDLGDARARDMLALGLLIAETLSDEIRSSDRPLELARRAALPPPFNQIVSALLAPNPETRPSARWVAERCTGLVARASATDEQARVRNTYARLRRDALDDGMVAPSGALCWLEPLAAWGRLLCELSGRSVNRVPATLLGEPQIARWLSELVGSTALSWPIARLASFGEATLGDALTLLTASRPAHAITLAALESALAGDEALGPESDVIEADPIARAATLATDLARSPPPESAIRQVELGEALPETLVRAAAKALRLRGELGRAAALANRLEDSADVRSVALSAEIFRRIGDVARAQKIATRGASLGGPDTPALRACLARIALDAGNVAEAITLAGPADSAATSEVLALAHARTGDTRRALEVIAEGSALPLDAEERARLYGVRGYVLAASDPQAAREAFAAGASHATLASALLEEATYLTGLGAAATDLGYLQQAVAASERACLIWDHLDRHTQAARAQLNHASSLAIAGHVPEATTLAERAFARANEAGDARAAGYASMVLCDLSADSVAGRTHAERAHASLAPFSDDTLRSGARSLRCGLLSNETIERLDRLALGQDQLAGARLEWLGERLGNRARDQAESTLEPLLAAVVSLSDAPAAIGSKGPALARALGAARELGLGDASLRLMSALRREAETIVARAGSLSASVAAVQWVGTLAPVEADHGSLEQSERLEQLVRSLGSGARLKELLRGVLDALVTWTGVERGLLLLCGPDGRLMPKVGRNLGERDLVGEQLRLSTSICERALRELQPVVAVDAATEFSDFHASVHALRLRSVLAVPLVADGRALGVVYLDDRVRRGAFGTRELSWVRTLSTLAATMVARAIGEASLRRSARRAERKGRELERALDDREAELAIATTSDRKSAAPDRAFLPIIGDSEILQRAVRIAQRVAGSAVPVLVAGESGSGKELFARAIHDASARRAKPFLSENVSAIPDTLLESALFGHVRGAFTGADRTRLGLFDAAHEGTLFLDEIGEMRLPMQTKLLRVLEDGVVRPLGTERTRTVDVRLIAATNRDLERMVAEHMFREDLFYRLGVLTIQIPPLRERPADISLLVSHFLEKHAVDREGEPRRVRVTRGAMKRLEAYAWPGNVRQLENEIRRALVLGEGVIEADHLSIGSGSPDRPTDVGLDVKKRIDALEISLVREALARTQGNQTQAAKLLGLSRFGLQKMIKRLSIVAP